MGLRRSVVVLTVAVVAVSCGGALPRETTANNARTDDPWLEGERCGDGPRDTTGLKIETLEVGPGKVVAEGQTTRVHYVAQLPDGTTVHDTHTDGPPIEIIVGSTKIICGFERALVGMHAGEQRRVTVPWRLAFGEEGKPSSVPARTDLVFVIDLFVPADPVTQQGGGAVRPAQSRGGGGGRGMGGH
jgi:FKBP-type peptidyl-prolyl cis-trans isomerase